MPVSPNRMRAELEKTVHFKRPWCKWQSQLQWAYIPGFCAWPRGKGGITEVEDPMPPVRASCPVLRWNLSGLSGHELCLFREIFFLMFALFAQWILFEFQGTGDEANTNESAEALSEWRRSELGRDALVMHCLRQASTLVSGAHAIASRGSFAKKTV